VIGLALMLYAVEFIADKIPWVDSIWDTIHTFIRPVGGALVAATTIGDASPTFEVIIALLGGTVAAGSHFTKASTRVAANASPEPFSNWALSFVEDVFVIGLGLLALKYPLVSLAVTVFILIAIVMAVRWIVRKLRSERRRDLVPA
jgi:nicotinamide riboside transporter PnuC